MSQMNTWICDQQCFYGRVAAFDCKFLVSPDKAKNTLYINLRDAYPPAEPAWCWVLPGRERRLLLE